MPTILHNGGTRSLFVVSGIGGETESLEELASLLPFQVYGLGTSQHGDLSAFATIEGAAKYHLDCLRTEHPDSRYNLAGYSFGGLVAFEMAQQLKERVGSLTIVDHVPPPVRYEPVQWTVGSAIKALTNTLQWAYSTIISSPRDMSLLAAVKRARRQLQRLVRARWHGKSQADTDYVFSPSLVEKLGPILAVHTKALRAYRPQLYPGPATLIRSTTMPLFRPYPFDLGWRQFIPNLKVVTIPGNHSTILREGPARQLARQIAKVIRLSPVVR